MSFKLAGEGSLDVAAWDKLGGFYHQFPSGFAHLCHDAMVDGNTEPHPGGMLTRWVGLPAPALIPKFL